MALRVKNISEGYVDGKGVFHPIRAAGDYKAGRAGEKRKYAVGKKRKPSKAKKTVTVAHKRVAAKRTAAQIKKMLAPKRRGTAKKNPGMRASARSTSRPRLVTLQARMPFYTEIRNSGKSFTLMVPLGHEMAAHRIAMAEKSKEKAHKNPIPTKWTKAKVMRTKKGEVKVMLS